MAQWPNICLACAWFGVDSKTTKPSKPRNKSYLWLTEKLNPDLIQPTKLSARGSWANVEVPHILLDTELAGLLSCVLLVWWDRFSCIPDLPSSQQYVSLFWVPRLPVSASQVMDYRCVLPCPAADCSFMYACGVYRDLKKINYLFLKCNIWVLSYRRAQPLNQSFFCSLWMHDLRGLNVTIIIKKKKSGKSFRLKQGMGRETPTIPSLVEDEAGGVPL